MNTNIQQQIDSIIDKSKLLHADLETSRIENKRVNDELNALKLTNSTMEKEVLRLREEEISLIERLEQAKQIVEKEAIVGNSDKKHQIDELVREIEYCINQLTK